MLWDIRTPFLNELFSNFSILGEEYIFILALGIGFWSIHKENSTKLATMLLISTLINTYIKLIIARPRPFQVLSHIEPLRLSTATGSSFPSGHTQSASTFYYSLATIRKKPCCLILATLFVTLVGVSRVYLGVHWISDVVFGAIFGILVIYLVDRFSWFKWLTLLLFPVYLYFFPSENLIKSGGAFIGFLVGVFLEKRLIRFPDTQNLKHRILRSIIGVSLTLFVFIGLKMYTDFIFIRYILVTFSVTFLAPLIFKTLRI